MSDWADELATEMVDRTRGQNWKDAGTPPMDRADAVEYIASRLRVISDSGYTRPAYEGPHPHVAGTTVGKDIETCAICGHDIRHSIHAQKLRERA
jgi:hypothetical protein